MPGEAFNRQDARLTITRALPTQNATVNSSSIDLGSPANLNALVGSQSEVVLEVPATTTATGQTQTFTVQDSADNTSFAAVPALGTLVLTGAANVTAAAVRRWSLPSTVRRYVRVSITSSATAGDQSGVTSTFTIRS